MIAVLLGNFGVDEKRIRLIKDLFTTALDNKVFSAAALGIATYKKNAYHRFTGYYGYDGGKVNLEINENHIFDLASLTKPLATVPVLLTLFERRVLHPDTRLTNIFKKCPADKKNIKIRDLMSHKAGFVAHREYYKDIIKYDYQNKKSYLLGRILEEKLEKKYLDKHLYSDIGFMLLGLIVEKQTGMKMGELVENTIYGPLSLQNELFFPGIYEKKDNKMYVATKMGLQGRETLSGIVHDDNSRAVGGETGHAGLFGSLKGVLSFCENLLDQWQGRSVHPSYSAHLLKDVLTRVERSDWTMGFDTVSDKNSSSGEYFSQRSVGHLGFTGTSFWMDPEKDCVVVLLSNRVYYGDDNRKIKKFRPVIHDLLMAESIKNPL